MKTLFFTATGNNLYVAKRIGGDVISIPELVKNGTELIEDDAIGIVCPVYYGDVPRMVGEFLDKVELKTKYLFFVATYGFNSGAIFLNVTSRLKARGLKVDYMAKLMMVDNYLPGYDMAEEIEKEDSKQIEEYLNNIVMEIKQKNKNSVKSSFSERLLNPLEKMASKKAMSPEMAKSYIVNDECIKCGMCAKVCPANNISIADRVMFGSKCEVCYACVHNCPKNAIHLTNEKSATRYRNRNIELSEIVNANNQI